MPAYPKPHNHYWLWLPAMFILLGTASILLLLLANRLNERQLNDATIVAALVDTQLLATKAHLWLEHVIEGDLEVETNKIMADLDQAIRLMEVIQAGGESVHGRISAPIADPALRSRAEEIKALLNEFKVDSLKRLEDPQFYRIGSSFDQVVNVLFLNFSSKSKELEERMEIEKNKNKAAFNDLFKLSLLAWAIIVASASVILMILERKRNEVREGLLVANVQLQAQAVELAEHREQLTELVDKRTAELKITNRRLQFEMAERLETEKQNHHLSNSLLSAQEIERKRLSMELHDALGQSLNVIKLQLRVLEKGAMIKRDECEKLLAYIDQVIDDVRRISRDLSPTILEDLGLTSALQWLTDNLKRDPNIRITADVENIDHLFLRKDWITIYRVVQEALTNIVKHTQAGNVSFVARTQDGRVVFAVEDDGKGFDPEQVTTQMADVKGLGLTTMRERVKIMGGDYDLWSRQGSGTRVTFSIPIERSEAES